jgi:hypothetical protein
MRSMTKSPLHLAREALLVGEASLPRFSCAHSRHDFTQAQLFALLVLKQALKTDYRGIVALAAEWRELREVLKLPRVPHYSTLCYAERRLMRGAEKGGSLPGYNGPSLPAPLVSA